VRFEKGVNYLYLFKCYPKYLANATSRGEAVLRAEHLLVCGIPNLQTIKQVNSEGILRPNQWNKIFIYKMLPTNTHMLSNSLSYF
jgi:hypothetical protein